MYVNKVMQIGRLTDDIKLTKVGSGRKVANFSIAVQKRGQEASFFDVVAWEVLAKNCAQYGFQGGLIHVEGELKQERWEKDGVKKSKVLIVADKVQFLTKKAPKEAELVEA